MRCSDIFMNVQEISPFYLRTTYLLPNPAQLFTALYMHSISLINEGGFCFHCIVVKGEQQKRLGNRGKSCSDKNVTIITAKMDGVKGAVHILLATQFPLL